MFPVIECLRLSPSSSNEACVQHDAGLGQEVTVERLNCLSVCLAKGQQKNRLLRGVNGCESTCFIVNNRIEVFGDQRARGAQRSLADMHMSLRRGF